MVRSQLFQKLIIFLKKTILYSPLTDTLKKDKYYIFKLKSDFSKEIVVFDGNIIHKLKSKNGIFIETIKINDNSTKVINNNEYSIFYKYKIS